MAESKKRGARRKKDVPAPPAGAANGPDENQTPDAPPQPEAAARRTILDRPPLRGEPERGTLRGRLSMAPVAGAAALAAVALRPAATGAAPTGPNAIAPAAAADPTRRKASVVITRKTPQRPTITGPGVAPTTERGKDDSFGKVLASRNVDRIVAESLSRLESARRKLTVETIGARERELKAFERERSRLVEKGDVRRVALIDDLARLASVEADAARRTLRDVERVKAAGKAVATLAGRVLDKDGAPAADVEVVFADSRGQPLSMIPPARTDADGMVWIALNKDQVAALSERGGAISAQVRRGGAVVASDAFKARLAPGGAYVFDMRAGAASGPDRDGGAAPGRGGAPR